MAKSILRQLFDGEIYPSESIQCQDPRYHEVKDSLTYEKEHFLNTLSESDCERFKQLDDLYYDAADIVNYDRFAYGFRLGALSVCEGMSESGFISLAKEIINQIANMAILKPPNIRSDNPEYEELTCTIADEKAYFLTVLSERDRSRFERLDALYFDVTLCTAANASFTVIAWVLRCCLKHSPIQIIKILKSLMTANVTQIYGSLVRLRGVIRPVRRRNRTGPVLLPHRLNNRT